MSLELALEGFLSQLCLDALLGAHLLEPSLLCFQLLQTLHHRGIHAAKFGARLSKVAELIPSSRHKSVTRAPVTACFNIARIWLSVNLDSLILVSLFENHKSLYLKPRLLFGEMTLWLYNNERPNTAMAACRQGN